MSAPTVRLSSYKGPRPKDCIWSLSNVCTDCLIDFCISRAHKTRVGSLAAFISNALAIDHDLPEPLPPYATL